VLKKAVASVWSDHQDIKPPLAAVLNLLLLLSTPPVNLVTAYCTPSTVTTKAWAEPGLRLMAATPPRRREKTSAAPKRIVPLGETHLHWALVGWRRFGKGQHRAALNFGDCFSYGLAIEPGQPHFTNCCVALSCRPGSAPMPIWRPWRSPMAGDW